MPVKDCVAGVLLQRTIRFDDNASWSKTEEVSWVYPSTCSPFIYCAVLVLFFYFFHKVKEKKKKDSSRLCLLSSRSLSNEIVECVEKRNMMMCIYIFENRRSSITSNKEKARAFFFFSLLESGRVSALRSALTLAAQNMEIKKKKKQTRACMVCTCISEDGAT